MAALTQRTSTESSAKELLKVVPIAWPTVILGVGATAAWLALVGLTVSGELSYWVAFAISAVLAFAAFTPMHDASHRSVSRRAKWLSEVVGRIAAVPLMAPFGAFRFLHLEHHKHTNEPDHDPDHWSGTGPKWLLPFKWATQDFYYYVVYFKALRRRPTLEAIEVVLSIVAIYGTVALCFAAGFGAEVAFLWLLPSRLALVALAWAFDYLPHRPHTVTKKENRFAATHNLRERWLTPFFLWQNYHLVHHLYPGVPFYRYAKVWDSRRDELVSRGAQEHSIFGIERESAGAANAAE